mgnify:CR=1 FL=1
MRVRFWGVRGSISCSGAEYARYGGNTSCLEVSAGGRRLIAASLERPGQHRGRLGERAHEPRQRRVHHSQQACTRLFEGRQRRETIDVGGGIELPTDR